MTAVVIGRATTATLPPPPALYGLSVIWTGFDGSTWDLSDYSDRSATLAMSTVTGLLWPAFQSQVTKSPALHGQRLQGVTAKPRDVSFSVILRGDGSDAWLDVFHRFCASWHPEECGTLTVTSGSHSRSIRLRLDPQEIGLGQDPLSLAVAWLPIDAIADDPFWYGDEVSASWSDGEQGDFFVTDEDDPEGDGLLFISDSGFAQSVISNPGSVPAWPVWQATAGASPMDFTFALDGGSVGVTIPAGKTLYYDTDPATGYADLGTITDGVFVAEEEAEGLLDPCDPRPIPAGDSVPVHFEISGSGTVSCTFRARYWLAIGRG